MLWTLSGVVMVVRPIEEVRGTALLAPAPPLAPSGAMVVPALPPGASGLSLEMRADGPRWVIALDDGPSRLADPASGDLLPALGPADASREVAARYRGTAMIVATERIARDAPPLELRRSVDAWRVRMSDGAHFYVDSGSGEIIARRTRWWRIYDFMWGIHIMDLQTREDSHNPWVIIFGALALVTSLLALAMLPLANRRRRT